MKENHIHLYDGLCWCGSTHSWEKAKHGTVNGLTKEQIDDKLRIDNG